MISGNIIGAILKNPETIILRTEDGQEYAAAMTDEEVILSAGVNDVREGETFAAQSGVETGEKFIPTYISGCGVVVVPNGSTYELNRLVTNNMYDYTKLQVIICDYNTTLADSTAAQMIAIDMNVYVVQSTTSVSDIVKNHNDKVVEFGISNTTGKTQILRYFTIKET